LVIFVFEASTPLSALQKYPVLAVIDDNMKNDTADPLN